MGLILGVSDYLGSHHDNSVALVRDGRVAFAAQGDRFSRRKHDGDFPTLALNAGLQFVAEQSESIGLIASGWPRVSFLSHFLDDDHQGSYGRLLRTLGAAPAAAIRDQLAIAARLVGRHFSGRRNRHTLGAIPTRFLDHYLAHAAAVYWSFQRGDGLVVILDTAGQDWQGRYLSGAVYRASVNGLTFVDRQPFSCSLGGFYSTITTSLGFRSGSEEGKTMALSAFADPSACLEQLSPIAPHFADGKWHPSEAWPDYKFRHNRDLLRQTATGRLLEVLVRRFGRSSVAASAQAILVARVRSYLSQLIQTHNPQRVYAGGGIFLNASLNGDLAQTLPVPFIPHFNPGDGGTALGAAYQAFFEESGTPPFVDTSPFLGRSFEDNEVASALVTFGDSISYQRLSSPHATVVNRLTRGSIVGLFSGRAEWGPRALGGRSVLADPRTPQSAVTINAQLKLRGNEMPFAPAILEEFVTQYFDDDELDPYMRSARTLKAEKRALVPAVVHHDGTARVQTVGRDGGALRLILEEFLKKTGIPLLLNTSMNTHGEPVCETPRDAITLVERRCLDAALLGNYFVTAAPMPGG